MSLSIIFCYVSQIGMSSATETLCGQAFGAKQYHMMGIFLQRSWFVDLVTLTILLPVFIFATPIFKLLGEEEAIANSAGYISLWFIPFIYSIVFALTIQMYLQAQQKNTVIAWLSLMQFVVHIPLSWLFVSVMDFGVNGAMCALCMSSWLLVFGEFVYIFGGWCPDSWKGFTFAALRDILPVVKLSISSGVMVCLELWYYAILVLLAGYMKNAEVAISAFSICLNICAWEFMISLGIMGYLFTEEEEVAHSVSDLSVLLAFSVLLSGIYPVLSGVAIGAGLQTKVAIINFVCFYAIGLPIGAVLGYVIHLQVKGIWIGMISGVITQTLALSFMTWKTNWDQEVSITSARLKRWYLKSGEENKQSSDHA
ncbi:hypothetical protein DH2020_039122 [Rehmannia glutinosa]|uniref:Uncharacterized protein n=1 Tax=Rehmannia glutinosa TaxID=99300 RepID=A0ABR0UX62_REHGL